MIHSVYVFEELEDRTETLSSIFFLFLKRFIEMKHNDCKTCTVGGNRNEAKDTEIDWPTTRQRSSCSCMHSQVLLVILTANLLSVNSYM